MSGTAIKWRSNDGVKARGRRANENELYLTRRLSRARHRSAVEGNREIASMSGNTASLNAAIHGLCGIIEVISAAALGQHCGISAAKRGQPVFMRPATKLRDVSVSVARM